MFSKNCVCFLDDKRGRKVFLTAFPKRPYNTTSYLFSIFTTSPASRRTLFFPFQQTPSIDCRFSSDRLPVQRRRSSILAAGRRFTLIPVNRRLPCSKNSDIVAGGLLNPRTIQDLLFKPRD
ncbi:hypothetical protein L1887_38952 [Cichorium endivia]|nr:hypothetical protein L1887_38952 [Cichorium endivia]